LQILTLILQYIKTVYSYIISRRKNNSTSTARWRRLNPENNNCSIVPNNSSIKTRKSFLPFEVAYYFETSTYTHNWTEATSGLQECRPYANYLGKHFTSGELRWFDSYKNKFSSPDLTSRPTMTNNGYSGRRLLDSRLIDSFAH